MEALTVRKFQIEKPYFAIHLLWISNKEIFGLVYNSEKLTLISINLQKEPSLPIIKYYMDPFFDSRDVNGTQENFEPNIWLKQIAGWKDYIFAVSNYDNVVQTLAKRKDKWVLLEVEDGLGASLPFVNHGDQTNVEIYASGLAIDLTTNSDILFPRDVKYPPGPVLMVMTNLGYMVPFSVVALWPELQGIPYIKTAENIAQAWQSIQFHKPYQGSTMVVHDETIQSFVSNSKPLTTQLNAVNNVVSSFSLMSNQINKLPSNVNHSNLISSPHPTESSVVRKVNLANYSPKEKEENSSNLCNGYALRDDYIEVKPFIDKFEAIKERIKISEDFNTIANQKCYAFLSPSGLRDFVYGSETWRHSTAFTIGNLEFKLTNLSNQLQNRGKSKLLDTILDTEELSTFFEHLNFEDRTRCVTSQASVTSPKALSRLVHDSNLLLPGNLIEKLPKKLSPGSVKPPSLTAGANTFYKPTRSEIFESSLSFLSRLETLSKNLQESIKQVRVAIPPKLYLHEIQKNELLNRIVPPDLVILKCIRNQAEKIAYLDSILTNVESFARAYPKAYSRISHGTHDKHDRLVSAAPTLSRDLHQQDLSRGISRENSLITELSSFSQLAIEESQPPRGTDHLIRKLLEKMFKIDPASHVIAFNGIASAYAPSSDSSPITVHKPFLFEIPYDGAANAKTVKVPPPPYPDLNKIDQQFEQTRMIKSAGAAVTPIINGSRPSSTASRLSPPLPRKPLWDLDFAKSLLSGNVTTTINTTTVNMNAVKPQQTITAGNVSTNQFPPTISTIATTTPTIPNFSNELIKAAEIPPPLFSSTLTKQTPTLRPLTTTTSTTTIITNSVIPFTLPSTTKGLPIPNFQFTSRTATTTTAVAADYASGDTNIRNLTSTTPVAPSSKQPFAFGINNDMSYISPLDVTDTVGIAETSMTLLDDRTILKETTITDDKTFMSIPQGHQLKPSATTTTNVINITTTTTTATVSFNFGMMGSSNTLIANNRPNICSTLTFGSLTSSQSPPVSSITGAVNTIFSSQPCFNFGTTLSKTQPLSNNAVNISSAEINAFAGQISSSTSSSYSSPLLNLTITTTTTVPSIIFSSSSSSSFHPPPSAGGGTFAFGGKPIAIPTQNLVAISTTGSFDSSKTAVIPPSSFGFNFAGNASPLGPPSQQVSVAQNSMMAARQERLNILSGGDSLSIGSRSANNTPVLPFPVSTFAAPSPSLFGGFSSKASQLITNPMTPTSQQIDPNSNTIISITATSTSTSSSSSFTLNPAMFLGGGGASFTFGFGQSGPPSTSPAQFGTPALFGTSTGANKTSLPLNTQTTTNIFGQLSSSNVTTVYGTDTFNTQTGHRSPFSFEFGATAITKPVTTGGFGFGAATIHTISAPQSTGAFLGTATPSPSLFGGPAPGAATTLFSKPTFLPQAAAQSLFGAAPTFGGSPTTILPAPLASASTNLPVMGFGVTTTNPPISQTSIFGGAGFGSNSIFGSSKLQSVGQTGAGNVFSSTNVFGGAPSFGSINSSLPPPQSQQITQTTAVVNTAPFAFGGTGFGSSPANTGFAALAQMAGSGNQPVNLFGRPNNQNLSVTLGASPVIQSSPFQVPFGAPPQNNIPPQQPSGFGGFGTSSFGSSGTPMFGAPTTMGFFGTPANPTTTTVPATPNFGGEMKDSFLSYR